MCVLRALLVRCCLTSSDQSTVRAFAWEGVHRYQQKEWKEARELAERHEEEARTANERLVAARWMMAASRSRSVAARMTQQQRAAEDEAAERLARKKSRARSKFGSVFSRRSTSRRDPSRTATPDASLSASPQSQSHGPPTLENTRIFRRGGGGRASPSGSHMSLGSAIDGYSDVRAPTLKHPSTLHSACQHLHGTC